MDLSALFSSGAGKGAAGGGIAGALIGGLSQKKKGAKAQKKGAAIGAAAGAGVGAIFGGVGAPIMAKLGSVLGGAASKLFGKKTKDKTLALPAMSSAVYAAQTKKARKSLRSAWKPIDPLVADLAGIAYAKSVSDNPGLMTPITDADVAELTERYGSGKEVTPGITADDLGAAALTQAPSAPEKKILGLKPMYLIIAVGLLLAVFFFKKK